MFLPPIATWLDLDLDALPLEPLEHPLVLLGRRKARAHRLPRPARANAPVLRLRHTDQRRLRRRVHRVVVRLEPPLDCMHVFLLARQAIQLVHRHQPAPRDALLRPVPEVALIARVRRDRLSIRYASPKFDSYIWIQSLTDHWLCTRCRVFGVTQ